MVDDIPPGELAEIDRKQLGDWAVEGSAEFENDAGDEGGARMDRFSALFSLEIPEDVDPFKWLVDVLPSGVRDAGTIRFTRFRDPKQDSPPKQATHPLWK